MSKCKSKCSYGYGTRTQVARLRASHSIHYPIQLAVLNRSRFSDLERLVVPLVFQVRRSFVHRNQSYMYWSYLSYFLCGLYVCIQWAQKVTHVYRTPPDTRSMRAKFVLIFFFAVWKFCFGVKCRNANQNVPMDMGLEPRLPDLERHTLSSTPFKSRC